MANPTTPGIHNHVHTSRNAGAHNVRAVAKVFGADAQIIEGVPIENGHGCLSIEGQLANHVKRVAREQGADAANEVAEKLYQNPRVRREYLLRELIARGMAQ